MSWQTRVSMINEAFAGIASVCVLTVSIYFCGSHTRTHAHSQAPTFIHSHSQHFSRWSFATLPQITAHTWQRSNNNNNDNKHDTLFHLGIWDLLSFICTSNTSINICLCVCMCYWLSAKRDSWINYNVLKWESNTSLSFNLKSNKMPQLRLQLQCR